MSEVLNFKAHKIKAQRSVLEDGLVDIVMGIYLILSGFFISNRMLIFNYIWLPIGMVLIDLIRRKIIYPRSGFVKLKIPAREIMMTIMSIIFFIILAVALVAIAAPDLVVSRGGWNGVLSYAVTIITAIFFFVLAYRFTLPRWYIHGILLCLSFILYRSVKSPWIISGFGGIVLTIGLMVLFNYIQKNPILHDEQV